MHNSPVLNNRMPVLIALRQMILRVTLRIILVLGRFADVLTERDMEGRVRRLQSSTDFTEAFALIVSQGIHRVENKRADPWAQSAGFELTVQVKQYRIEKGLGLATACSRSHHHIVAPEHRPDGLLLRILEEVDTSVL